MIDFGLSGIWDVDDRGGDGDGDDVDETENPNPHQGAKETTNPHDLELIKVRGHKTIRTTTLINK